MRKLPTFILLVTTAVVVSGCGSKSTPNNDAGTDAGVDAGNDAGLNPVCGDAILSNAETCDDGNTAANDGCSATCTVEPGWKCLTVGGPCVAAKCGDGVVAGQEKCDDGNATSNDGCSSACQLEDGFKCDVPGQPCQATVCGDGNKEGTEQCDDGNLQPFDGCSSTCGKEPSCANGACTLACGDGIVYPGEECDDGNNSSGDGCSATCKLETGTGYACTNVTSELPDFIDVPVIYRDFKGVSESGGHPDFEAYACNTVSLNLVEGTLDGGVPVFNAQTNGLSTSGCQRQMTSAARFDQWYRDTPNVNKTITSSLRLTKQSGSPPTYLYDSALPQGNAGFFPLDGVAEGWGLTPVDPQHPNNPQHDFHFTTEARYWFTFQGDEKLDFSGDDDVWVFINGKLALDLGGLHPSQTGSVTLDTTTANALNLQKGLVYEMALFHAERHTSASNFKLTLGGFVKTTTHCASVCGDGTKAPDEECDDGNTQSDDGCSSTCHLESSFN